MFQQILYISHGNHQLYPDFPLLWGDPQPITIPEAGQLHLYEYLARRWYLHRCTVAGLDDIDIAKEYRGILRVCNEENFLLIFFLVKSYEQNTKKEGSLSYA